jgi:uncharacterized protein YecT (DUF1311 family)
MKRPCDAVYGYLEQAGKDGVQQRLQAVLLFKTYPRKHRHFSTITPAVILVIRRTCIMFVHGSFSMPFGIGSGDCTQERSSMKTIFAATGMAAIVLSAGLSLAPHPAAAASFDCEKTDLVADEKVICDTRTLNDADVKMVTTFDILTSLLAMGNRDQLRQEQSDWLTKRRACEADVQCLTTAYAERMKQLQEAFSGLSKEPL